MKLPLRVQRAPGTERVLSVDGAFGAPGLNLSHWPGNATPPELAHELSTGACLAFARLAPERQAVLAAGCRALVNNHVDTDGVCASFAVLHPEQALPRAEALLAAAAAGDYFRVPSEAAFVVDQIVTGLFDAQDSPLRARFAGLSETERHELAWRAALQRLPAILDGAVEEYAELWRAPLAALRCDLEDLARARRDDLVHLELTIWTAASGAVSSRPGADRSFDPGRHALFGSTQADRALVVGPRAGGATYRLILNTTSWFDRPGVDPLPRPELAALAERLNELEGSGPAEARRWHAQPVDNPAPELWFGRAGERSYSEHSDLLESSALAPEVVVRALVDALRAVWAFPE